MVVCKIVETKNEDCDVEIKKLNDTDEGADNLVYLTWTQCIKVPPFVIIPSSGVESFDENVRTAFGADVHRTFRITMKLEINRDADTGHMSRLLVFGDFLNSVAQHFTPSVRFMLSFTLKYYKDPESNNVDFYSYLSEDLDVYYDVLPEMGDEFNKIVGFSHETFKPSSAICRLWTGIDADPRNKPHTRWEIDYTLYLKTSEGNDVDWLNQLLTSPHNDLTLVASDGQEIRASKIFVAASSDVFARAFEQGWKESESHRYEMKVESAEAIMAFLEFIYACRIDKVETNSSLAVEVLELAHKYNVVCLEQAMKELFRKKHHSWIGAGNAVKLFRFLRNVEDYKSLKMKAVWTIIWSLSTELEEWVEFDKLFEEDFMAGKELCGLLMHEWTKL